MSDELRVYVVGNLLLIGSITAQEEDVRGRGTRLWQPAQIAPMPMPNGAMSWVCLPLPLPWLDLLGVVAEGFPSPEMVTGYQAQIAELSAARSGLTLPRGPGGSPRRIH